MEVFSFAPSDSKRRNIIASGKCMVFVPSYVLMLHHFCISYQRSIIVDGAPVFKFTYLILGLPSHGAVHNNCNPTDSYAITFGQVWKIFHSHLSDTTLINSSLQILALIISCVSLLSLVITTFVHRRAIWRAVWMEIHCSNFFIIDTPTNSMIKMPFKCRCIVFAKAGPQNPNR